jgi:hypothetical protein
VSFQLDAELSAGAREVELKVLVPNPQPFESGSRYENGPTRSEAGTN